MVSNLQQSLSGLYEITKKLNTKIQINSNDYSAFEVFANDTAYTTDNTYRDVAELSGYVPAKYLDEKLAAAIPSGMTEKFNIRSTCPPEKSDMIIYWGDGEKTVINDPNVQDVEFSGPDSEKEYKYTVQHTYTESGKYIIRIYGNLYYAFSHSPNESINLMCRVFEGDLPVASHLHNFASTCYNAKRLFYVQLNGYDAWAEQVDNAAYLFSSCSNLLECNGFKRRTEIQVDDQIFMHCINMRKTDYKFKSIYCRPSASSGQFNDCPKLAVDVLSLLPDDGFFGTIKMWAAFSGDVSLTCSNAATLAAKLWENSYVTFTNTSNAFTNCSETLRAMVPTSWGGTNEEIEAKIQAGYWQQSCDGIVNDSIEDITQAIQDLVNNINS